MANNTMTVVGVGLLILAGILVANQLGIFGGTVAPATGDGANGGTITVETAPEDVTLTWNDFDLEDRTNDPGSKLRIYSPDLGNITDDGTQTMSPNEAFSAVAGIGSSTYYAQAVESNSGTKDQNRFEVGLARAGALTLTAVNDDAITKNAAANPQQVDANDEREIEITYDVGANRFWGSPDAEGESVVVFQYNKTTIQSVTVADATRSTQPNIFAFNSTPALDGSDAWVIENLVDGEKKVLNVIIKSTSTNPSANEPIIANFYDGNVDLDQKLFSPIRGVEDENNAQISIQPANLSISIS